MFRVLGVLVAALVVGILLLLVLFRQVIWPAMHRRRMEVLARENERLDRQLAGLLGTSDPEVPTKK